MAIYICAICDFRYDEEREGVTWDDLPDDWVCPVCDSGKDCYALLEDTVEDSAATVTATVSDEQPDSSEHYLRVTDEFEEFMADIHTISRTGRSIIEPMRTRKPSFSWDDILIKGAQIAKIPLNEDVAVNTKTIIGKKSLQPMELETPIYITHMSFGALSKEAKIALAKGSAAVKTAMCSGEGGILPESLENAYKYIFEYVPNKYSLTEENLKKADAVEIKLGQSAKPGMGGHLPGSKVTPEIAAIRGVDEGSDVISPSHFDDILDKDDLKKTVDRLRGLSGGKPIGIKVAAGNIEDDLAIVLYAEPDFITIDGRAGATGAASKFVKASTSVPTIFALHRARKFLDENHADDVALLITGGFRISPDFVKALALGADAVAIGTAAMIAIGCQQYRVCNTGKCPMGIATQDPVLRSRFDIDKAASGLENFLTVSTTEMKHFARLTGNDYMHDLSLYDICTTNTEISAHTDIEHV